MEESVLKAFGVSVILFGGYIFLRTSPYRRFRSEHLRTDRFALHILGFALASYLAGVILASIVDFEFQDTFVDAALMQAARYSSLQAPVICTLVLAPLLGLVDAVRIAFLMRRDPAVVHLQWRSLNRKLRAAAVARFVLECDDEATRLLHRAIIFRKPMLITLKGGKVYVGVPMGSFGDPSVRAQSLKIIPLYSGYRNAENQKVELPTKYRDVQAMMKLRQADSEPQNPADPLTKDLADLRLEDGTSVEIDVHDLGVVIQWAEIQTLSLFDENIYQAFQGAAPTPAERPRLLGKDGLLAKWLLG